MSSSVRWQRYVNDLWANNHYFEISVQSEPNWWQNRWDWRLLNSGVEEIRNSIVASKEISRRASLYGLAAYRK
jgi:hypothetical protein